MMVNKQHSGRGSRLVHKGWHWVHKGMHWVHIGLRWVHRGLLWVHKLYDTNIPTCWYWQRELIALVAVPNAKPQCEWVCDVVEYRLLLQ